MQNVPNDSVITMLLQCNKIDIARRKHCDCRAKLPFTQKIPQKFVKLNISSYICNRVGDTPLSDNAQRTHTQRHIDIKH